MVIDPDDFQPLPIRGDRVHPAQAEAEAVIARAHVEAQQIRNEARALRTRTLAEAAREADTICESAHTETRQRKRRDDQLDTWAARAIIAGTVGLTASGEYALARMVGFDRAVAWLLPFVIDVYVIQAFRRHRDIVQAISLTVAANVTYHLAEKGLFGVEAVRERQEPQWWLIAMVASVASLILWRVHLMTAPPKTTRERQKRPRRERQDAAPASPKTAPEQPTTSGGDVAKTAAKSDRHQPPADVDKSRQEAPAKTEPPAARKPAPAPRQNPAKTAAKKTAKKAAGTRRSMDEWVALTEVIFHAEFARLKRNPTASEFANAIDAGGHGRPSDSTAKNIRTEILDRAELPALD